MADKKLNILFLLGGILGLLGTLLFYLDNSLALWQFNGPLSSYYLNAFGTLYKDGSAYESWSMLYLISAIIIFAGSGLCLAASIIGNKKIGIIGSICLFAGLGFFVYAQFDFISNPVGSIIGPTINGTGLNPIWANYNSGELTWRLGYGFFIVSGGAIISLIGFKINSY